MSDLEALGRPEIAATGDGYRLVWPSDIEATVERIGEHRDDLTAEVTIRSTRQPTPGLLHSARLNLMSTQARKTLAASLAHREPDLDWAGALEQLCFLVRERYRNGEPATDLRVYTPAATSRWLLEPFVEESGPTVIFADGGSLKTMLGCAISVSIASGTAVVGTMRGDARPVLYLDWESDRDTAAERVHAISAGANITPIPEVHYRRQAASLAESASEIRREVVRLGAGFVVIDSLGAARGGEPESADVTIRLFNAARSLGVPWLGLDHVTKAAGNTSTRPFGSAFTHNLARVTWGADKVQEPGATTVTVALKNHKRNNGRLVPQIGYRLQFENDQHDRLWAVRFGSADIAEVPGLAEGLPLRQRIIAELKSGPVTQSELADSLGVPLNVVTARTSQMATRGELVRLDDRKVALAARGSS